MPFRQIDVPMLGRKLSNVMACLSSGEPDSYERGLDEYYRFGGNGIHLHGEGGETHSRETAGRWLRKHDRTEFFVCTQICHEGWDAAAQRAIDRSTPEALIEDVATDLELIGTDYLDLVYLANNPGLSLEPVMAAIGGEIKRGRIRHFGVRNWTAEQMRAANACAARVGIPGIAAIITTELALPVAANPLWPNDLPFTQFESAVHECGLAVLAHADDFNQGHCLFDDAKKSATPSRWTQRWCHPQNESIIKRIRQFAAERRLTPLEVTFAWLLNRPFPTIALISLAALLSKDGSEYKNASKLLSGETLTL